MAGPPQARIGGAGQNVSARAGKEAVLWALARFAVCWVCSAHPGMAVWSYMGFLLSPGGSSAAGTWRICAETRLGLLPPGPTLESAGFCLGGSPVVFLCLAFVLHDHSVCACMHV